MTPLKKILLGLSFFLSFSVVYSAEIGYFPFNSWGGNMFPVFPFYTGSYNSGDTISVPCSTATGCPRYGYMTGPTINLVSSPDGYPINKEVSIIDKVEESGYGQAFITWAQDTVFNASEDSYVEYRFDFLNSSPNLGSYWDTWGRLYIGSYYKEEQDGSGNIVLNKYLKTIMCRDSYGNIANEKYGCAEPGYRIGTGYTFSNFVGSNMNVWKISSSYTGTKSNHSSIIVHLKMLTNKESGGCINQYTFNYNYMFDSNIMLDIITTYGQVYTLFAFPDQAREVTNHCFFYPSAFSGYYLIRGFGYNQGTFYRMKDGTISQFQSQYRTSFGAQAYIDTLIKRWEMYDLPQWFGMKYHDSANSSNGGSNGQPKCSFDGILSSVACATEWMGYYGSSAISSVISGFQNIFTGIFDSLKGLFMYPFTLLGDWINTNIHPFGMSNCITGSGLIDSGSTFSGSQLTFLQKYINVLALVIPIAPPEGTTICTLSGSYNVDYRDQTSVVDILVIIAVIIPILFIGLAL